MLTPTKLNKLAPYIYEQNKERGWWDDPDRCIYECLMLVVTEIAEATEGDRKGLMDDHLKHRKMEEVELADALIRLLDLAGRYGWGYDEVYCNSSYPRIKSIGGRHLVIVKRVVELMDNNLRDNMDDCNNDLEYSVVVNSIISYADAQGYDLDQTMMEKLDYNKTRSDHDRANRAKEGGKKY